MDMEMKKWGENHKKRGIGMIWWMSDDSVVKEGVGNETKMYNNKEGGELWNGTTKTEIEKRTLIRQKTMTRGRKQGEQWDQWKKDIKGKRRDERWDRQGGQMEETE